MTEKIQSSVKYWSLLVIAGLIFIVTGILNFSFPLASYLTITTVFSYLFVIEGVSEVIFSIANRKELKDWGWTLFYGLVSIVLGIILILNPEISASTMPLYFGIIFLIKSMVGVSLGLSLQKQTGFGNGLVAIGVVGVILSTILMVNPIFAGFTILFTTGVVLIASGVYSFALGLEFRKIKKEVEAELASENDEPLDEEKEEEKDEQNKEETKNTEVS